MKKIINILLYISLLSISSTGLTAEDLDKVVLQLKWKHQFQFAGYYAAIEKGYYRDAGLEVELKERQVATHEIDVLLAGDADYAVTGSNVLVSRAAGKPLVALAAISQKSPLALLVLSESGIKEPIDLIGKRIMVTDRDSEIFEMLHHHGVNEGDYERQQMSFNLSDLIEGRTDAYSAYITDQGFKLQELGINYRYIAPPDYGINFYNDVLITTEQEINNNPQRVARFREASIKGWRYAFENSDEIIELILNKYNLSNNSADSLKYEAYKMSTLVQPLLIKIGQMRRVFWNKVREHYINNGLLSAESTIDGLIYNPIAITKRDSYKAKESRCLLVYSYHKGYAWNDGIDRAASAGLEGQCKIRRFYMDSKRNADPDFLRFQAKQINQIVEQWQPDVVIAADDNASRYFVEPYLKDSTTPVLFCGINWSSEEYGYPYSNATGMVEVAPIIEIISHSREMLEQAGKLKSGEKLVVDYIDSDLFTAHKEFFHIEKILEDKNIELIPHFVSTFDQWQQALKDSSPHNLVMVQNHAGIANWNQLLAEKLMLSLKGQLSISYYPWMKSLVAFTMAKEPEEQGEWVADRAKLILSGISPEQIPIDTNKRWHISVHKLLLKQAGVELPADLISEGKTIYPVEFKLATKRKLDIGLTDSERAWLSDHKSLRMGIDPAWLPFEFADENGKHSGISSDLIKKLQQLIDIDFELVPNLSWSEVMSGVKDKTIDLTPALFQTTKRDEFMEFTDKYLSPTISIITNNNNSKTDNFKTFEDLLSSSATVAVGENFMTHDYLSTEYPEIPLITYPTVLEVLQALNSGEADAAIVTVEVTAPLIHAHRLNNLKVNGRVLEELDGVKIGVRKGLPELTSILNKALKHISSEEIEQIRNKWTATPISVGISTIEMVTIVVAIIVVFGVIILTVVNWNRTLKRNVALQTRALRSEKEQTEGILSSMAEGLLVVDKDGVIERCNPYIAELAGVEEAQLVGVALNTLFSDRADATLDTESKLFHTTDSSSAAHTQVECRWVEEISSQQSLIVDGADDIPLHLSGTLIQKDPGSPIEGAILVLHDMSILLNAESIKRSSIAKDEFLASMSHELRTPLTSIIGNSELLLEMEDDSEKQHIISSIESAGRSQLALVNDILDMSKIDSGKFTIDESPYDLELLLTETRDMLSLKAQDAGLKLALVQDNIEKYKLLGDGQRIGQILINLIGNAIKFTEEGGVTIKSFIANSELHFEIADSGIGMDSVTLRNLFERFEQADSSISRCFGGSGLGLFISKSLAELMGGRFIVASEEGAGSTFTLVIPYRISSEKVVTRGQSSSKSILNEKLSGHVLIAEDTPELQMLERRVLEKMGLQVTVANNGEEAVNALADSSIDLILMDMQMPIMDGIEATKAIRKDGNLIPIIALTANVMQKHRDAFNSAGCNDFIAKPIDKEVLKKVLKIHLKSSTAVDEVVDDELIAFVESIVKNRIALVKAVVVEDWDEMRKIAYVLKGSAISFGQPKISKMAEELQLAIDSDESASKSGEDKYGLKLAMNLVAEMGSIIP